jgi:phosphoribosylformimino-5-aminoimidazole carboxamide ribotide isomerase
MTFIPIPAIDIRGGRCVRLVRGDFSRQTVFGDDPVEMARKWQAEGAERLHVVDLDGARDGVRANAEVIARLIDAVEIPVQVGGGVRTLQAAQELVDIGVDRVVVGTALIDQPEQTSHWVTALGTEHLIVAVDARDGLVTTHGWQSTSGRAMLDVCHYLAHQGVRRVLYTDVSRDGTGSGPDFERTRDVAAILKVIGSGGVSTVDHLRALAEAGAEGAIIGTALYDGTLRLQEALAAC